MAFLGLIETSPGSHPRKNGEKGQDPDLFLAHAWVFGKSGHSGALAAGFGLKKCFLRALKIRMKIPNKTHLTIFANIRCTPL